MMVCGEEGGEGGTLKMMVAGRTHVLFFLLHVWDTWN